MSMFQLIGPFQNIPLTGNDCFGYVRVWERVWEILSLHPHLHTDETLLPSYTQLLDVWCRRRLRGVGYVSDFVITADRFSIKLFFLVFGLQFFFSVSTTFGIILTAGPIPHSSPTLPLNYIAQVLFNLFTIYTVSINLIVKISEGGNWQIWLLENESKIFLFCKNQIIVLTLSMFHFFRYYHFFFFI